ncbi:MAG: ProQ/FinO family protein [Candidatus Wallbacteria bacterium]|nr:ProQ/FinO family protein [Candidatus Wallbacteria bacterium]
MTKRNRKPETEGVAKQRVQPPAQAARPTPAPAAKPPKAEPRPRLTPEECRAKARERRNRYEARHLKPQVPAILAALTAKWPDVFPSDPAALRPFAIGLHADIDGQKIGFPRAVIRMALKTLCKTEAYQAALAQGGPRYGLDGLPQGEVSAEARAEAAGKVQQRKAQGA